MTLPDQLVYTGNSINNATLAKRVAKTSNLEAKEAKVHKFSDGELSVSIPYKLRKNIFIFLPARLPFNDFLIELLLVVDAATRAGARDITAIIPYIPYSRQDKISGSFGIKAIAKLMKISGINNIITLDIHSEESMNAFSLPIKNIGSYDVFAPYIIDILKSKDNCVIVSPDSGAITRAKTFADKLGLDLVNVQKKRDENGKCHIIDMIGSVKDKYCIIVDDIIDGGSTVLMASELLMKDGASGVCAFVTHGIFSNNAIELIEKSKIQKLYISDSINNPNIKSKKIQICSVADTISCEIMLI